jgi:hypothetical protein
MMKLDRIKVRIMGMPGKSLGNSREITWNYQGFSWEKAIIRKKP